MIAIVGIACRYPDAPDPRSLWETVLWQRRAFRRIPSERLDLDDYFSAERNAPDKTYSTRAALLEGWEFDREAFQIPGSVFRATDPAHWLALETAERVLADAGHPSGSGVNRDRVAVVIGNTLTGEVTRARTLRLRWPYVRRVLESAMSELPADQRSAIVERAASEFLRPFPETSDESLAGGLSNTIAGRICNHFDMHGGGYTVDGACASSLLAVITGCSLLLDGSADLVLAGGVDLSLDPFELIGFAKTGALADTDMRVYDAGSSGFWPGEGCGMVALMRTADASGRRKYAEIAGWGVSSDGKGGITRPERDGQLLALRRAYERAGLPPSAIGLFEGHGTGTAVGDATELAALSALCAAAPRDHSAPRPALGSIKANIGHTKAAAGVAGLIKAAMSLTSGVLPPTTGCHNPHPILRTPGSPLRVLRDPEPWPDGPRSAGVSAMGFGGINTHVVLRGCEPAASVTSALRADPNPADEVFVLRPQDPETLRPTLRRIAVLAPRLSDAELHDLAYDLADRDTKETGELRVALVARTGEQLSERADRALALLADLDRGRAIADGGVHVGYGSRGRVTVLFPGQGAPVYSAISTPVDTAIAQPAIFRASVAGLRRLERLGVMPGAAVGHSLGEITGLFWAGCISEADADRLVTQRGRIMSDLGAQGTGMVSIAASAETAPGLCAGTGLVIAAHNGPASYVLAGHAEDVALAAKRAEAAGIPATTLAVSRAFHSAAVAECAGALTSHLAGVLFGPPLRTLVSTVTGRQVGPADDLSALLRDQVTAPVRFWDAVRALAGETDLFCEVGPGRGLAAIVAQYVDVPVVSMDVGGPGDGALAETAAALYAAGAVADLASLFAGRLSRPFNLWRDPAFLANPCSTAAPAALSVPRTNECAGSPVGEPSVDGVVVGLVAAATELPPASITPDRRLLSDLHLTSLKVAQLITAAAQAAGKERPIAPLTMADASIAEVTELITALPAVNAAAGNDIVLGVAPWVRCFTETLVPIPQPPAASEQVLAEGWADSLITGEPIAQDGVLYLPNPAHPNALQALLAAARAAIAKDRLTVVAHEDAISGFLRSLHAEHPTLNVTLLRVPARAESLRHAARHIPAGTQGYQEIVLDTDGRAWRPQPAPLPQPLAPPDALTQMGPDDVVLSVAKGIGYECATALAKATGVRLALIGRSPKSGVSLEQLLEQGIEAAYEPADITDPDRLAAAVQALEDHFRAPVTGIIHAAGINQPRRFTDLTDQQVLEHLAPKITGLANLLGTTRRRHLRLLVTFGSVIGRHGLAGESHYALANGLLRAHAVRLARDLPHAQVLNVDWTAWVGAGMAERLGVLDALLRADVTPLPAQQGAELFMRLLATPDLPPTVAVHGRLGLPPAEVRTGRFLEDIRVGYPGVELIADTPLNADDVDGHRLDGVAVLPAVLGLEAMSRAASALAGRPITEAREIAFNRPVIIPENGPRVIRVCALHRGEVIETILRSDETDFRIDHFRALFPVRLPPAPLHLPAVPMVGGEPLGERELYGPLCFHTGAFQRVRALWPLGPYACRGEIEGGAPEGTVLGDAATNDAVIHALQACVPHRRLLPVACDRLVIAGPAPAGVLHLRGAERKVEGKDHIWDVAATDRDGRLLVTWSGLRLRDVGPLARMDPWPPSLLAIYLQRSAVRLGLHGSLRINVESGTRSGDRPQTGVSRSHLDGLVLDVAADGPVACDWESASSGAGDALGPSFAGLIDELRTRCAEPADVVATRVWTVVECLSKTGRPPVTPLVLEGVYEGGWAVLRAGDELIASVIVRVAGAAGAVAVALLAGASSAHV